ncbi:MAG: radical SAM protein [Pseudomonadota bacterium]
MRPDPMRTPPALPPARPGRPEPRRALLVLPFYPKDPLGSAGKHVLTPATTFPSLAGATPADWEVSMWDENLLQGPLPTAEVPQVVGITVHLTFARRAIALARWFRARGSLVVMGGLHVEACPEELAPHADALSFGDGVHTWPAILRDAAAGRLQPRYHAAYRGFADDPSPDRSILPPGAYLTPTSLIATRGCHNRCGFCYLSTGRLKMPREQRPVEAVARELAESGSPYAVFIDNNLGSDPGYLAALCAAIAPLGCIWSAAVSLDVTDRPDVVRAMARAGCTGVFIGFESLTDANLEGAGKRCPAAADYARRVAIFQEHGIQVNASFVLGFDHDGPDVFRQVLAWIEAHRIACATYHILTPYPGTPLFRQLEREGRLLHRDWERYDTAHCVFRPARMSPAELEAGYAWLYRQTFTAGSIWRRRPADPAAVPAYLAMTALYKKTNPLWARLIRLSQVQRAWAPLVEASRRRHLKSRKTLLEDTPSLSLVQAAQCEL